MESAERGFINRTAAKSADAVLLCNGNGPQGLPGLGRSRMTSGELENLIKSRLGAAGLARFLDEGKEQYLEFPDGFFAEVVLRDGSRLPDAQRILRGVKEELAKQGVELSVIVRAIWEVVSVQSVGAAPPGSNGFHRFIVSLRSGGRECTVTVDVTGLAVAGILNAFRAGSLKELASDEPSAISAVVGEFVRYELSHGGESYWDPTLDSELTLNENALSYLLIHAPTKSGSS